MDSSHNKAKVIIERYREIWMGLDNVTSIGIGKTNEGRTAIVISLEKDNPSTRDIFPVEIEDTPVKFKISGKMETF